MSHLTVDFLRENAKLPVAVPASQTRPGSERVFPTHSNGEQVQQLFTVPEPLCTIEPHDLVWMFNETSKRIAAFETLVREGKELTAALGFAQFVFWSGLLELFERHHVRLGINAPLLRHRVKELQDNVRDRFKGKNQPMPQVAMSELQAINHKLDVIAGWIANGK